MRSATKKSTITFELRVYRGDRHDPSRWSLSVPFVLEGGKISRMPRSRSTADPRAIAVSSAIWAYLRYPTHKNTETATVALSRLGGVERLVEAAPEIAALPEVYGQLVRLPCPRLALPGDRLHEYLGLPDGASRDGDRWRTVEAADLLEVLV